MIEKKSRQLPLPHSLGLALVLLFWGSSHSYAQVAQYKYQLEKSHDADLCRHMTKVFNQKFRTPWNKGYLGVEPNPTIFGKPYDQIFERLPGVEYDKNFTWDMLYSKYPSSPEFEAVQWKEGRYHDSDMTVGPKEQPILLANIDIDNDGQKDWVVKSSFMFKMPTNVVSGAGNSDFAGWDQLRIFPPHGLDLTVSLTLEQLTYGQKPDRPPRRIAEESGVQLRPFIYNGKTYLSAYEVVWHDEAIHTKRSRGYRIYPDREYLNVLQVTSGGKRFHSEAIETANTKTVCRIRMDLNLIYNTPRPKGN